MFQAEPVLWLQSLASPALTELMGWVTWLGYTPVYAALVLFLAFAVRLRPALAVLVALLLAGIATEGLKTVVALPRPSDVDERVAEPGASGPVFVVPRGAATSFWGLPTAEARAAIRAKPDASYGFPSGHVSAALTFCLGVAAFFRWRAVLVLVLASGWPLVMGVSRMYLGRHFLADVIGGLAIGALAIVTTGLLLRWWDASAESPRRRRRIHLTVGVAVVLAGASVWLPWLDPENAGRLLGLLLGYAFLENAGFPRDAGVWPKRAVRFLGAVFVYLAASRALDWVLEATASEDLRLPVLVAAALTISATVVGGVYLGRRTRAYDAA